jgi:hypothetical protein
VQRLQRIVDSLEKAVDSAASSGKRRDVATHSDNPVYIEVKGQLDSLMVERDRAAKRHDELQSKFDDYERRMARAPEVEREFHNRSRELETAQLEYKLILAKQTESQVSQNLETEHKGERFTMIEPPQAPEKPISPNRTLIVVLGLVLSVGLAAGAAAAHESLDASVRGPNDIRQLLQVPPLASIPIIRTLEDRARQRRRTWLSLGSAAAAMIMAVVAVHLFVRPLDVLWSVFLRRFGV